MGDQTNTPENQSNSGLFGGAASTPAPADTSAPEGEKADDAASAPNEKEMLMQRARLLGLTVSNNIGVDTLRDRIRAKMEALDAAEQTKEEPDEDEEVDEADIPEEVDFAPAAPAQTPAPAINALTGEPANAPKKSLRQKLHDEQMRLVRVRITCMDPKKKDLPGEIFTIANEYLGTVRKFVPFGEFTDDGFHVPFCIYTMMDERKFLNIRVTKDRRTGQTKVDSAWAKEFALEILPPLSEAELHRLATAQAAAGSID